MNAVLRSLRAAPPRAGRTRVLAIDGRGGSGKSTLAGRIATLLDAPVLHMDDLYPGWDGLADAAPLLRQWVLEPLARGVPGRHPRYDWGRGAYGEWSEVPAAELLVVEGCGCGSRVAAPYLSLLLWVDAPLSVRFERGIERDGEDYRPHWERWARQEDVLFAAEKTRERADYRIDGAPSLPHDPEHEIVLA
ncbi:MAG TPA: uridine kinase [Jiangellaceae bacterium]|nr:uridine kinase [Jiangellaceae bacterium]